MTNVMLFIRVTVDFDPENRFDVVTGLVYETTTSSQPLGNSAIWKAGIFQNNRILLWELSG